MMEKPTIVCVLGMHRSGTSLIARMLDLLGASLGPADNLVQPAHDNPTGFWEYQPIVELNMEILSRLGGTGMRPPTLAPGWETSAALDDLRVRARNVVSDFADESMWAWKDPRTCLTLAFWQALLGPMRYVICVRDPEAVAQSLKKRNRIPIEAGIYLWLRYLTSALDGTDGKARHFVFYDQFVTDPVTELRSLAHFVGVPDRATDKDILDTAGRFVDPALRHHVRKINGDLRNPSGQSGPLRNAVAAYDLMEKSGGSSASVRSLLETGLSEVSPAIVSQRVRGKKERANQWANFQNLAAREIAAATPDGAAIALIDGGTCVALHALARRKVFPFPDKYGSYGGRPADNPTAVADLERMKAERGVEFLVVAQPAFWWLDYYAGFADHLGTTYTRVAATENVKIFRVRR
jgi:hypothetical protein